MKNRQVGYLVIGISLLMGFLIWLFNNALTKIVNENCSHGAECAMWGSIRFQTNVGLGILVFVLLVGLYLVFFAKDEPAIREIHKVKVIKEQFKPKKITKENYEKILGTLEHDERVILEQIIASNGSVFQSQLVEETKFTKVKITRILDRLEGKGVIERKRRGMTNIVLLKHQ
jgi:hypothetical protein